MKRLMIVADNSFAAQSIRLALRQTAGFQVIGFVDGSVPISMRVAEIAPDVVLVDDTQEPEHATARLGGARRDAPRGQAHLPDDANGRRARSRTPSRLVRRP